MVIRPVPLVTRLLLTAVYPVLLSSLATAQTCYHLDGSTADGSQNGPCNFNATGETGSHTSCCSFKNGDARLVSRLCLDTASVQSSHLLWSSGCTNSTFQDAACPKLCTGGRFKNAYLQPCNDTAFCCNELDDDGTSGRVNDTQCFSAAFTLGKQQIGTVIRHLRPTATASSSTSGKVVPTSSASNGSPPANEICQPGASYTPSSGVIAGLTVEGAVLLSRSRSLRSLSPRTGSCAERCTWQQQTPSSAYPQTSRSYGEPIVMHQQQFLYRPKPVEMGSDIAAQELETAPRPA
ncbi:uncharacterized protein JN550_000408 [Neoarthrinium moseri]|uniref:uncharacterized protein n=1 Tax=Neoarthrinium moseri TaxID=1658444 RepID=UPI001FDC9E82|nr:uncharacterized protein JN550_000408 [Neoarthrinium moseri]KAI1878226.1 hypothetical protein JN550_000408 [Neoarthrinium moseri]